MATNPQTLLFILKAQDQASQALQGAGLAVASLGFAMGAAGLAAVKAEVDFNRSFTQMQTLAGVTAGEIGMVSEAVKQMAIDTGQGPQQLAQAMYFVSSAGFNTAEALDVVKASAQGAAIGLGTTDVVAQAVTSAMSAYGHEAMTAAEATGIMAKAVQDGKVEAAQLAPALGNVIPIAAQVGVSFRDVNAAVAAMSLSGLSASRAVTGVRQTLLAISAPTNQARVILKGLGVDYHDLQKTFQEQGYLAGVERLYKVLGTPVNVRRVLGDVQAFNANAILLGNNLERTKQIFQDVGQAGEQSLTQAFKVAAASDSFKWDQGIALLKVALIDLGDLVMPLVVRAISAMLDAYQSLKAAIGPATQFFNEHKTAIIGVAAAIATLFVINALPGILLTVAAAVATATIRMEALTLAVRAFSISSLGAVFTEIATGAVLLGQAALAAVPEVVALAAALWATGIPEIIIAVAALGAAIYYLGTLMTDTSDGVVSGWQEIYAEFQAAEAFIVSIMQSIGAGITEAWNVVSAVVGPIWKGVVDEVVGDARELWGALTLIVDDIVTTVSSAWTSIYTATAKIWDDIKAYVIETLRQMASAATLGLSEAAIAGYNAAKPALQKAGQAAGDAYHKGLQASAAANAQATEAAFDASLKSKLGNLATTKGLSAFQTQQPKPKTSPFGEGGQDYETPHKPKKAGKTDDEKEQERIDKTVQALQVQAQAYAQSAQQVEYLDNVRRAGLNTLTLEQVRLEDGLAITDKEAAASTRLSGIREIARQVLAKHNMEQADANRDAGLSIDNYAALATAEQLDARQRAITTAGLNAETAARQKHGTEMDVAIARANAERVAAAKFDSDAQIAATQRTKAYADDITNLQAQAAALNMTNREAQVYIAGVKARTAAEAAGATDAAAQQARAQTIAGMQYDLQHHTLTATQGVNKYMDELRENAISTGSIVYSALGTAMTDLTNTISAALSGQTADWGKAAADIATSIEKMIVQMLLMKAVMAALKIFGFATGGTPGTAVSGAGYGTTGLLAGPDANALGNVFAFAGGGDFTNQVVDQATMFAFSNNGKKKLGVMGEAGPEAIVPLLRDGNAMAIAAWAADGTRKALGLTRGPDGKLGVHLGTDTAYADGGAFPHRGLVPMGSSGRGGNGGGTQYIEGDTHIHAPVSVTYGSSGDASLDEKNIAQLRKITEGMVDDRIGKALDKVNRNGGRMAMFGMN